MDATTISHYGDIFNILVKITVLIGTVWAVYKFVQYRELKQRIQLDIDANIYKLTSPEKTESFVWDKKGKCETISVQPHTHAIEIRLKFTNKGFIRMRLFNIQVGVKTMQLQDEAKFSEKDGHLYLKTIFRSGNIVPLSKRNNIPVRKTSFYYIEPGVEQIVSYFTLITEPRELIQVYGKFSLEQKRIFPEKFIGKKGLNPHTVSQTYKIDLDGTKV